MNYGTNKEPDFLPEFNLEHINERGFFYNLENLYMGYFGVVPSQHGFAEIDLEKFHREFPHRFKERIRGYHFNKFTLREDWRSDFIYVLEKEIILQKGNEEITILFHRENCELVKEITNFIIGFKKEEKNKSPIYLIIMQTHGLDNKKINFEKPELNLSKIYNDDFETFHRKTLKILNEDKKSGLHLLYGKPGTGKSTYIRYLCGLVKKKIVFLPGQMAQNLDNVAMTRYLINNPNSVLVIEDAEELIVSRDQQRNSNLAMILNITDGILGESLGIQIIATFNTDVHNIDPALKRKGRLQSAYEFRALSAEKASVLLREQDPKYTANGEMTLAEIYNITEEEQYKEQDRKAVGFR